MSHVFSPFNFVFKKRVLLNCPSCDLAQDLPFLVAGIIGICHSAGWKFVELGLEIQLSDKSMFSMP